MVLIEVLPILVSSFLFQIYAHFGYGSVFIGVKHVSFVLNIDELWRLFNGYELEN